MLRSKPGSQSRSPLDTAFVIWRQLRCMLDRQEVANDAKLQELRQQLVALGPTPGPESGTSPDSSKALPPVVEIIGRTDHGDMSVDLSFDGPSLGRLRVIRLPRLSGLLFDILSDPKAEGNTGTGFPFKSRADIVRRVNDSGVLTHEFKPGAVAEALRRLRKALEAGFPNGGALVECRHGLGWRIALRRVSGAA